MVPFQSTIHFTWFPLSARTSKPSQKNRPNLENPLQPKLSVSIQLKGFCGIRVTAVKVPNTKRKGRTRPMQTAAKAMEPPWKRRSTAMH